MASTIIDRYGNEFKHAIPRIPDVNADPLVKLSAFLPPEMRENASTMLASFASAFTQKSRFIQLQIGDDTEYAEEFLPQSVEGHEELSGESHYEVICLSYNGYHRPEQLQGLAAQIKIATNTPEGAGEIVRCGLITHVDILPSDGGFAKYRLIIESPLALLEHRRTSRVFQDMTVQEIIETVLADHDITKNPAIGGILEVEFRLRKEYKQRSYCLQYRETDAFFIHRTMFEEGMFYRLEHIAGKIPKIRLVIYDDPYSLPEATQKTVRFHRAAATENEDSLTEWNESRQIGPSLTTLRTYDYKPVYTHEVSAKGASPIKSEQQGARSENQDIPAERSLEDYDAPGNYYGKDQTDVTRYADLRRDVHDRQKVSLHAAGNLRQLHAGEWFQLEDHPNYQGLPEQEREFVACALDFNARNNLPKGLTDYLERPQTLLPDNKAEQEPPYWVTVSLRKRGQPLAPDYAHTRYAKPTARGPQVAVVVGPEGEEVYTDEHGRIKVQLIWPRPKEHPEYGADFNDRSACWMRIVYSAAGAQWGRQQIPRINQEVLVDFIEGDIDRPIIVGVLYNGTHPPPHFSGAGSLPANRTLSGIKTKEFHSNNYNELIFDDTQGEIRTRLSSEHGKTQLNQGFLIHPRTNGKGEPRGDGAELRTDRHIAIRAAEGLLLTTEPKKDAIGKQLDREKALSQLEAARKSAQDLAKTAEHQTVDDMEIGPEIRDAEGQPQDKTQKGHLDHMVEAVKAWEAGTNTDPDDKTATEEQPGKQALLLASGVDGIGLTTPQEMILSSGRNLDTISRRDTQQTTVRRWLHNVGKKISLFVVGVKDKVNLKLTTALGHAHLHAQSGDVEVAGDQNLRLYAGKKQVLVAAQEEVLIVTRGGAYIKLGGADIQIHCPGTLSIKSASKASSGPTSVAVPLPDFPLATDFCLECWLKSRAARKPIMPVPEV